MVDDMIFYNDVNIPEILQLINNNFNLYCIHLKLYPGICYSHTNDKLIAPPKFEKLDCNNEVTYLKYRRSETELDWNYPFDFCGSIYRLDSV